MLRVCTFTSHSLFLQGQLAVPPLHWHCSCWIISDCCVDGPANGRYFSVFVSFGLWLAEKSLLFSAVSWLPCTGPILVNWLQVGEKPWFGAFSSFYGVNKYSHRGQYQALRGLTVAHTALPWTDPDTTFSEFSPVISYLLRAFCWLFLHSQNSKRWFSLGFGSRAFSLFLSSQKMSTIHMVFFSLKIKNVASILGNHITMEIIFKWVSSLPLSPSPLTHLAFR